MSYKRLVSIAALLVILAFPASASMVSFLLVETGIDERASSGQYSSLWEGGLMEAFFDAGHIVTNSPIARMVQKPNRDLSGIIEDDFNEAVIGGADYFVLGYLEYNTGGGAVVPFRIVLKLFDSNSRQLIFEQNFPAGTGRNFNEEFQLAQDAGRTIISRIKD